jgi:hypothetical protein
MANLDNNRNGGSPEFLTLDPSNTGDIPMDPISIL